MSPSVALSLTLWRGAKVAHAAAGLLALAPAALLWLMVAKSHLAPSMWMTVYFIVLGPYMQCVLTGSHLTKALKHPKAQHWARSGLNRWLAVAAALWWFALVVPASLLTQSTVGPWVWGWFTALLALVIGLGMSMAWRPVYSIVAWLLVTLLPALGVLDLLSDALSQVDIVQPAVALMKQHMPNAVPYGLLMWGVSALLGATAAWLWAHTRSYFTSTGQAPTPKASRQALRSEAKDASNTANTHQRRLLSGLVHLRTEPAQRWGIALGVLGLAILLRHPIESIQASMIAKSMIWFAAWAITSLSMPWAIGSGVGPMGWKLAPRAWLVPGGLRRPLTSEQLMRLTGPKALKRWLIINALLGVFAAFYADFRWHDLPALLLWTALASLLSAHLWLYIAASHANPMNVGVLPLMVPALSLLLAAPLESTNRTWWWLLAATGISAALAALLRVRWARAELRA